MAPSTKTLLDKLQFKEARKPLLFHAPESVQPLIHKEGLSWSVRKGSGHDFILAFFQNVRDVDQHAATLLDAAAPGARVWFAYAKKTSPLFQDLYRDKGWAALADSNWLPVMQIAINDDWSALRWKPRSDIASVTRRFTVK